MEGCEILKFTLNHNLSVKWQTIERSEWLDFWVFTEIVGPMRQMTAKPQLGFRLVKNVPNRSSWRFKFKLEGIIAVIFFIRIVFILYIYLTPLMRFISHTVQLTHLNSTSFSGFKYTHSCAIIININFRIFHHSQRKTLYPLPVTWPVPPIPIALSNH